jgi:hypothetical protein
MNINGALFMCISNMTFQNVLAVINVSIPVRVIAVTPVGWIRFDSGASRR